MNASTAKRCLVVIAGASVDSRVPPLEPAVHRFWARSHLASAQTVALVTASAATARDQIGVVQHFVRLTVATGRSVRVHAPPNLPTTRISRGRWVMAPLPGGVARLTNVPVPHDLITTDALILVNELPTPASSSSPVLGVWSRFVPLKVRLGALVSGPREGFTAEIALAFRPAVIVLAGRVRGFAVAVATDDQVAAELVGLALASLTSSDDDPAAAIGPWEDALVQRATELGIGVSLPADISVRSVWSSRDMKGRAAFDDLVDEIVAILGIPNAIDHREWDS